MSEKDLNLDNEAVFNAQLKAIMEGADVEDTEEDSEDDLPEKEVDVVESEESDSDEQQEDAEDDSDEVIVPQEKASPKKGSKEEAAIIALKRENKRLQEEMRNIQTQKQQDERIKAQSALEAKYLTDGYDADTAKYMAERETRLTDMEQRVELSEFKADNAQLFVKYPEAKQDASTIMKHMKATGLTAEQICTAMYQKVESERDSRAKAAAKGTLQSSANNDNPVSRANRSAATVNEQSLSAYDRKVKEELERNFTNGEKLSNKRYFELKAKHGL